MLNSLACSRGVHFYLQLSHFPLTNLNSVIFNFNSVIFRSQTSRRSLAPGNILWMLTTQCWKLIDFGISSQIGARFGSSATGMLMLLHSQKSRSPIVCVCHCEGSRNSEQACAASARDKACYQCTPIVSQAKVAQLTTWSQMRNMFLQASSRARGAVYRTQHQRSCKHIVHTRQSLSTQHRTCSRSVRP